MARDNKYGEVTVEYEPGTPFGEDEPVFILRGQDRSAPMIIQAYAHAHEQQGELFVAAKQAHEQMLQWQRDNPDKVKEPD